MLHAAIKAAEGTLPFRTWAEGCALWERITQRVPARALGLMPDHLHGALADERALRALSVAIRSYALWRNRARGTSGPVFAHRARATRIADQNHLRRTVRYIHLNSCREKPVTDPLAWPFSTHRDMTGFAWPPVCGRARDPESFHRWVSSDVSVAVAGSFLPVPGTEDEPTIDDVLAAVSALTRTPLEQLSSAGPARALAIGGARILAAASAPSIADALGVSAWTVRRSVDPPPAALRLVARATGDGRFGALGSGDLRCLPSWRRFRPLR